MEQIERVDLEADAGGELGERLVVGDLQIEEARVGEQVAPGREGPLADAQDVELRVAGGREPRAISRKKRSWAGLT